MTNGSVVYTYTFFNKKYGVEVKKGVSGTKKPVSGRIYLRFFPIEQGKDNQIIVKITPSEAFKGSLDINKTIKTKQSAQTLIHKFDSQSGSTTTSVKFDAWERNGRSGYGIAVSRTMNGNSHQISVSLSRNDLLFLGEILKRWAVDCCFSVNEN